MRAAVAAFSLLLASTAADDQVKDATQSLTPCQQCCSPGGDCSRANHGNQGKCCGSAGGNNFCCP